MPIPRRPDTPEHSPTRVHFEESTTPSDHWQHQERERGRPLTPPVRASLDHHAQLSPDSAQPSPARETRPRANDTHERREDRHLWSHTSHTRESSLDYHAKLSPDYDTDYHCSCSPSLHSRRSEGPYDPYVPPAGAGASGATAAGGGKTAAIQAEIDATVDVMRENINKVAQRGERLDALQDKTGGSWMLGIRVGGQDD